MNEFELLMIEGYEKRNQEDSDIIQDFETTVSDGLFDDSNDESCSNNAILNNS